MLYYYSYMNLRNVELEFMDNTLIILRKLKLIGNLNFTNTDFALPWWQNLKSYVKPVMTKIFDAKACLHV